MEFNQDKMIACQRNLELALLSVNRIEVEKILMEKHPDVDSLSLIEKLVVPVLEKIGEDWAKGIVSLSQVYMSGRICEEIVELILPRNDEKRVNQPKMGIVTFEDYHLLGKRIVYATLRASGFELENLGRMGTRELIDHVIREKIRILLVSVLMLPSALKVKELQESFEEKQVNVKILVGGAPFIFDRALWKEVRADGMGTSASEAVHLVQDTIKEIA